MKLIILSFLLPIFITVNSVYLLQVTNTDGSRTNLEFCKNKKVLIVNIASGNTREKQIGELQELQKKFGNKLVILAFPSNSFSHESRTDLGIKQYCTVKYNTTFFIAQKTEIIGTEQHAVYAWLTSKSTNGIADYTVKGDFQKFILNESGEIIGYFSSEVSPLDKNIVELLKNTSN